MTINFDSLNQARATAYAKSLSKAHQGIQETAYKSINSLFSKVSKAVSPFFAHLKQTLANAKENIKDFSNKAVEWIKDYPNSPKYARIGAIIGSAIGILGILSPIITVPLFLSQAATFGVTFGMISVGAGIALYSDYKGKAW